MARNDNPDAVRQMALRDEYLASKRNIAWVKALEEAKAKPPVGPYRDDGIRDDIWFLTNPARRYRVRPWRLSDGGNRHELEGTITVKDRCTPAKVIGQHRGLLGYYGFWLDPEDSDRYGRIWIDMSKYTDGFRADRLSAAEREAG